MIVFVDMIQAEIWIGLSDEAVEGKFVWVKSRRAVKYTNWDNGEPNNGQGWIDETCTYMYPGTWKWNDLVCNKLFYFVCEYINIP